MPNREVNVIIEFNVGEVRDKQEDEQYRRGRFNYSKANYKNLKNFFETVYWSAFIKAGNIHDKWKYFPKI